MIFTGLIFLIVNKGTTKETNENNKINPTFTKATLDLKDKNCKSSTTLDVAVF